MVNAWCFHVTRPTCNTARLSMIVYYGAGPAQPAVDRFCIGKIAIQVITSFVGVCIADSCQLEWQRLELYAQKYSYFIGFETHFTFLHCRDFYNNWCLLLHKSCTLLCRYPRAIIKGRPTRGICAGHHSTAARAQPNPGVVPRPGISAPEGVLSA